MRSAIAAGDHCWRRLRAASLLLALMWAGLAPAYAAADAQPQAPVLKIGIIGTGRIGSALARLWAKAGYELTVSSRHPEELQALATELGPRVHVGTPEQAAAFADVVLVAIPYAGMPQLGTDLAKQLSGKIIIDASNPVEHRDGAMAVEAQNVGAGVETAKLLHSTRVVRAFNCINFASITSESFRQPERRGIPIGGDDAEALAITSRLISDAGFDAALIGSLAHTRTFDLGEPLSRLDWTARQYLDAPLK